MFFNNKFNKWLPLTKEPIDTLISNEADIKNIENKFQMSNISTNITQIIIFQHITKIITYYLMNIILP